MLELLKALIWPEWRAHPWRQVLAVLAVALGVALAWSVHLINGSALAEFAGAVRAVQGEPDASLVCDAREGCSDAAFETLAAQPEVVLALPVIELDSYALPSVEIGSRSVPSGATQRVALRIVGTDALQVWRLAPSLVPRPAPGEPATATLDPDALFLNSAAFERLGVAEGDRLPVQQGAGTVALRVAGRIAAGGPPLALIDIAGAQHHFGFAGRLSRIDLRLTAGADVRALDVIAPWRLARPDEREQRVSNVSRAYRVNLTVLALVALFVGAFLVFAVLALSVAQRVPSLALLGVLGLSARERAALLRAECALLGVAGSGLGLALGTALAQAALRWLAGDLGGGYFPGAQPALQFSWPGALLFGTLGVAAAMVGGWLPARQAGALAPAQALKGLGGAPLERHGRWSGPLLLAAGTALAFTPAIGGLPIGAYLSVALLLVGGIACVPLLIDALLARAPAPRSALPLLALKRAHHERDAASVAVAGVVASLALAVAITVMVASFRDGVARWLEQVLPADIYLRSASSSSAAEQAFLPPGFAAAAARLPGVARIEASRVRSLLMSPTRPAVTLLARPNVRDGAATLPLVGAALPPHATLPGVFVSEAVERLYDAKPGSTLALPLGERMLTVQVRGVWRDYARQFGAIMIDAADYRGATGDERLNDLALWVAPGTRADEVLAGVRALAGRDAPLFDIATTAQLRVLSLAIFDRSFAVTRYLQAVAIGIGLAGIAASFSAQVWARRREFGLLAHLGFTRAQTIGLVAGEGAVWTAAGALVGLTLGLAVAVVLVHVVNPQSFHWTMELLVPWGRVALLLAAVLVAGAATAAVSARAAAGRRFGDMVAAVKEDW